MSAEVKKEIQLEIARVLFIDIVGYSKRLINEQQFSLKEQPENHLNIGLTEGSMRANPIGKDALEGPIPILQGDPMFDPFRNDPRFEKLVASPAPKEAK